MSEFQLSLLIIGAVVVVAVYGYGYWQQWRYRRSLGSPFAEDIPQTKSKAPALQRVEHGLDDPLVPNLEQALVADTARDASVQMDERSDYIVQVTLKYPLNSQALDDFLSRRFDYGKTIRAIGCNAATGAWERLIPESVATYTSFKIGLQLVDRNGAVSDTRLADFRELLAEIGRKLDSDMVLPMVDAAIERARELDKFCAEVDQMIGINLLPAAGRVLFASEVARAVQQIGMSLQADGAFHQFDETGATLFTLSASDESPFQHHRLDQTRVDSLTFLLDIPRVNQPVKRFDEMTLMAMEVASTLGATLVDDQRVTLGKAALLQIREQVESVERRMLAGSLIPGGEQALRLFS